MVAVRGRNLGKLPRPRLTTALICSEDGKSLGVCDGPLASGRCPWQGVDGRLPCNGAWLTANGWTFQVAEDARLCPLAALGIAPDAVAA
jgi:hypothetical protein